MTRAGGVQRPHFGVAAFGRSIEVRKLVVGLAIVAAAGVSVPAAAQSIHQREQRQEQRIRQGERSGQLTPAEARRLHFLEARLHRTEARMRWRNGGRLTPYERRRLASMEQRDNAEIYRLKHNWRRY